MTKYKGSESNLQKTVAKVLNLMGVLWCHVPNERKTDLKQGKKGNWYTPEGSRLKAEGVKKGVSDVLIFEPRGGYSGMAIELKVGYNKPSTEQKEWLTGLKHCGWKTFWSNDLDEILEEIDNYFKEPRTRKNL